MERYEQNARLVAAAIVTLALVLGSGCASTEAVSDEAAVGEQVNAGYTMRSTRAVGGSVTMIPLEVINNSAVKHVEELLDYAPGVWVTRRSSGFFVRIRGGSSMFGSNEPLYVVNGVPLMSVPGGSILGINPRDVASISILRGASAAMYGSRGGNGVVVIETKRVP